MSDRSRSFSFDSSQTILDLREVISDIGRISFPPYALYYRGARLQDDDFLFEIGYEDSALIDVRLIPGATSTVRVNPNNGKSDIILETDASDTTVADLKVRLADEFDLPPEMELVASGKVLHEIDTVAEAGLTHESYVHVYAKDEFLGDTAMEMTTFEFSVGPTQDELSLPWFDATTVGDARCDLAKTLFKPVAELSIVDPAKRLCLQDADKLAEYATPGRPFLVLLVDGEAILTAQECRVIAKWMPGTDVEAKGKELFLQCGRKLTVFQRTCKTRGYV
jgi:hypothetical protein